MSEIKQMRHRGSHAPSPAVQGKELDLNDPSVSIPTEDICSGFTDSEVYKVKVLSAQANLCILMYLVIYSY